MTDRDLANILRTAKCAIGKPETWCKGEMATTRCGERVDVSSTRAERWCAVGASMLALRAHCIDNGFRDHLLIWVQMNDALIDALPPLPLGRRTSIKTVSHYNDAKSTDHADIIRLYDRAIESLDKGGEQCQQ